MSNKDFLKIYIPALELALKNDHKNYGYCVNGPEYFIESNCQMEIDNFIESVTSTEFYTFLNMVGYYFDAISHNFPSIQGIEINDYKEKIIIEKDKLKELYLN